MKKEKIIIEAKAVILSLILAILCIAVVLSCGGKSLPTSSSNNNNDNSIANNRNTIKKETNLPSFEENYNFDFSGVFGSNENYSDSGENTSDSGNTSVGIGSGGNTEVTPTPTPPTKTGFSENSYIEIYTPWIDWYPTNVSWEDTNTLTQIWEDLIFKKGDRYGRTWCIRDGDNRIIGKFKQGNYYYFDDNLDIVHTGNYADEVKVKQFLGGVIIKYSGGDESGTLTVGGLYKTLLNKDKNNSQGQQGYARYNNNNFNEFMRATHNRGEGDLSVILMNIGYDKREYLDEYGIDEYYSTIDNNYIKNPEYFLGKNPNSYMDSKLNVKVNHSANLDRYNFNFIYK